MIRRDRSDQNQINVRRTHFRTLQAILCGQQSQIARRLIGSRFASLENPGPLEDPIAITTERRQFVVGNNRLWDITPGRGYFNSCEFSQSAASGFGDRRRRTLGDIETVDVR